MHARKSWLRVLPLFMLLANVLHAAPTRAATVSTVISSLKVLSLAGLEQRRYAATLQFAADLPPSCRGDVSPGRAYAISYRSDDLLEYARVDVPARLPPRHGFPVIIFAHGWVGLQDASKWSFNCSAPGGYKAYSDLIEALTDAGFVVVEPGYRGHGEVNGVPADGIEFLRDWDNASYLSPQFYAIDILNLVSGLRSLRAALPLHPPVDLRRLFLKGHSQGGDVAMTVAAVMSRRDLGGARLRGASIWAGTFAPPLVQLRTYRAMEAAPQAFLAGDGSWTGTAIGHDGRRNPDFVFGFPSPSIENPDPASWTWQKARWSAPSYQVVLQTAVDQMYRRLRLGVADMPPIAYRLRVGTGGMTIVDHDPAVLAAYRQIGAGSHPEAIRIPLILHHSDHDFYSLSSWNRSFCDALRSNGVVCRDDVYPGNTHELGLSGHSWFTPAGSTPGFRLMIDRDIAFFRAQTPFSEAP